MDSNINGTTYQYWYYLPRGETYAIRLAGPNVTGVCGPLEYCEVIFSALPTHCYQDELEDIAWVRDRKNEFVLCETEYEESMIWI